ncbi:hypothetical protein HYY74_01710 [Candidatus Woesearchaeota archaeon]|nr:hypothetical protein [Candidatus Woesearchaeota archaeon]
MQTMIRVENEVLRMLEDEKSRANAKSYNEVIRKLLEQKKISMLGADKSLKKWNEPEDRAKFRA